MGKSKKCKNLTYSQKLQIQALYNANTPVKEIAKQLGKHISTVYIELKRGYINGTYNADYSNQKYLNFLKAKGKKPKLEIDKNLANYISKLILEENLSIVQVKKECKKQNIDCPSRTTIYKAIDENLIPNVTRESLRHNATTMFSKGLIQIPKYIREKLDLKDKDELSIELKNEKIIIKKINN